MLLLPDIIVKTMRYFLDDLPLNVDVPGSLQFIKGDNVCLSQLNKDPTLGCSWYKDGYTLASYEHLLSHETLSLALNNVVQEKLKNIFPSKNLDGFDLAKYHKYISEDDHRNYADPVLKRLYVKDLPNVAAVFTAVISELLGFPMTFQRGGVSGDHWIILRINPPYSFAYNPPHKDIYEDFDHNNYCPQMVNAWIPVAGVNRLAGLGLSPGSHLLNENKIIRCRAGSEMNGRKFSVNLIKSWDGSVVLSNIYPSEGSMLCFSSHLIHGLGVNRNKDITRVALEFRLHR